MWGFPVCGCIIGCFGPLSDCPTAALPLHSLDKSTRLIGLLPLTPLHASYRYSQTLNSAVQRRLGPRSFPQLCPWMAKWVCEHVPTLLGFQSFILSIFIFSSVCVCSYVFGCICMRVCMHTEARSWCWVSFSVALTFIFEKVSHWT